MVDFLQLVSEMPKMASQRHSDKKSMDIDLSSHFSVCCECYIVVLQKCDFDREYF